MQLRRTTSALFGSLALLGLSSAASAAAITFGAAQNDTADTDVSTTGTLVAAYSVSGPAVTVNTVPFAAFPVSGASATNGNTTVATSTGTITNPGSAYGTPSSSSMSTNYKSILSAGSFEDFAPSPTFTITFSGLTLGQQYKVQLWVNDSRPRGRRVPHRHPLRPRRVEFGHAGLRRWQREQRRRPVRPRHLHRRRRQPDRHLHGDLQPERHPDQRLPTPIDPRAHFARAARRRRVGPPGPTPAGVVGAAESA